MANSVHLAAVALAVVAVSACAEAPPARAPLGTFGLDRPAMIRSLLAQGIPEGEARRHAGALDVRLLFEEDGRFRLEQVLEGEKPRVRVGTWARKGDRVTLFTDRIGVRPIEPPQVSVASLSGDRLVFGAPAPSPADDTEASPPPLPAYVLVRR